MAEIAMHVDYVGTDSTSGATAVILNDSENRMLIPIWIGRLEAQAIALELEGDVFHRPKTHDLFKSIFNLSTEKGFEFRVEKVVINRIEDDMCFALLCLNFRGRKIAFDARPSDAIAIALRTKSPIFVTDEVLAKAGIIKEDFDDDDEKGPPEGGPSKTIH